VRRPRRAGRGARRSSPGAAARCGIGLSADAANAHHAAQDLRRRSDSNLTRILVTGFGIADSQTSRSVMEVLYKPCDLATLQTLVIPPGGPMVRDAR